MDIKIRKPIIIIGLLILTVLMVFSVPCDGRQSQSLNLNDAEQAWLAQNHTVRVRVSNFPPYIFLEGTEITGLVIDYLNLIAQRTGVRFDFVPETRPWQEALQSLMNLQGPDLMTSLSPMAEREPHMIFSNPYIVSPRVIFTRKDAGVISSTDDLRGKTLAVSHGTMVHKRIEVGYPDIKLLLFDTDAESIRAVSMGEADAYIGNLINASSEIIRKSFINLKVAAPTPFGDDIYTFGIRRDWPELNSIINKALNTMTREAELAIRIKWLPVSGDIVTPQRMALTPEERAWLKAHSIITLGSPIIPPWNFVDESTGQYKGIVPDYIELIGSKLGITFKNIADDFGKIHQMAREKKIDGISVAAKTAERAEFLNFPEPYVTLQYSIVTQKESTDVATFADLAHKRTGILEASAAYSYLKKNYPDVELMTFNAYEQGILAVLNGEIDAWVGSLAGVAYVINKKVLSGLKMTVVPFEMSKEMSIGVRKDWPELAGILSKAIQSIDQEEHSSIRSKWLAYFPEGQKVKQVVLTPEERDWLKAHPGIRVGLPEGLEPYVMADQQGNQSGILVDFKDELSRTLGTNLVLETMPSSKILEMSRNRAIDVIYAVEPYKAEQEELLQTNVWAIGYPAIYARQGISFKSPEDMAGKTVVLRPNTAWDEKLIQPYSKRVKVVYAETPLAAMKMVLNEEADIYLGLTSHRYAMTKYRLFGITQAYVFSETQLPFVMGVRSDWPVLISILNKGLTHIGKEGLRKIVAKWVQLPQQKEMIELTAEEKAWLDKHHTIRVSFWQHPPFFYSKDGKVVGIAVNLLNAISKNTGITFQMKNRLDRFSDVLKGLKEHEGPDLVGALMPTTERKNSILFTIPYFNSPRFIFTRDDAPFVSSIESLSGKKIAVVKDNVVHRNLVENYPGIDLLISDTNEEALRAVSMGEAVAFIGDLVATPAMINEFGLNNLKAACPSGLPDHPLAIGIRNDWPELRDILNKALDAIPAAEKAAIINKWSTVRVEHGIRRADVLKWILVVGGSAFSIVLLFFFWNRTLAKRVKERTSELSRSHKLLEDEVDERTKAEELLRESRDYLKNLTDSMPDAIFSVKLPERIIEWANDTFRTLGYEPDECVGRTTDFLYPSRDEFIAFGDKMARAIADGQEVLIAEHNLVNKSGDVFPAEITLSFFKTKGDVVRITVIGRNIAERKRKEQKLQEYQQRLKSLVSQLTIAEEGERRRIAADLHDHVGQSLALARMQIAAAKKSADAPGLAAKLNDISETLREAVHDTRHLMFDLSSPTMHEIGLGAAISEWLEEQIEKRHEIKTKFFDDIVDRHKIALDENVRAILFRNVRELLTNVVKHAQANQVTVSMEITDGVLKIILQDDGVGFEYLLVSQTGGPKGGFGLFSIRERMIDLGGALEIESQPGKGCKAILTVPLDSGLG